MNQTRTQATDKTAIESFYSEEPDLLLKRISESEKNFKKFQESFTRYVESEIQLCHSGDSIAVILEQIGQMDSQILQPNFITKAFNNTSSADEIQQLASTIAEIQTPLDSLGARMNAFCSRSLGTTLTFCNTVKGKIRQLVRERLKHNKKLQFTSNTDQNKPIKNFKKLTQDLKEKRKNAYESDQNLNELLEVAEAFERRRFEDLKASLKMFAILHVECLSRSLPLYTKLYKQVNSLEFNPALVYQIKQDKDAIHEDSSSLTTSGDTTEEELSNNSNKIGNKSNKNSSSSSD